MKTIIKTGLIAIAMLLTIGATAQEKSLSLGVKAGLNMSNITGDYDNGEMRLGFIAGLDAEYALSSNLYLNPGLYFVTKGANVKNVDASTQLSYLTLPVHIGYKIPVSEGMNVKLHAGPYIGYAMNGKLKALGTEIDLFKAPSTTNRFDFGAGLGVGLELGKMEVGVNSDFGLGDISKLDGVNYKNLNAFLTLGYRF